MNEKSRRTQNIERLAAALQDCFDVAVEEGARRAEERMEKRMEKRMDGFDQRLDRLEVRMDGFEIRMEGFEMRLVDFDKRFDRFETHIGRRLDRQDETLRMVWKQVKGEGPLPVDFHD